MASVILSWSANPTSDNVTSYEVWGANGTSVAFGSCSLLATISGLTWTDIGLPNAQARTYYIRARNIVGPSLPDGPINITTDPVPSQPFGFAFECFDPVASKPITFFDLGIAWTIPSGLTGSQGTIGDSDTATATPPTAQTDFDIQSPPGTSIGTMRFAASSLTATFIAPSNVSIPLGQAGKIVAPSNLNGLAGTIFGSIKGTR